MLSCSAAGMRAGDADRFLSLVLDAVLLRSRGGTARARSGTSPTAGGLQFSRTITLHGSIGGETVYRGSTPTLRIAPGMSHATDKGHMAVE